MVQLFSGQQLQLIDQIALLAGRKLDLVYASLVHQLRLSPGFFKKGWGDLGVVNFEEDAKLFRTWPPPHFDQTVPKTLLGLNLSTVRKASQVVCALQLNWNTRYQGKNWGVECETLEVSFRCACSIRQQAACASATASGHAPRMLPLTRGGLSSMP